MNYEIQTPAFLGSVVTLYSVADSLAKAWATAGGTEFNRPAYHGALRGYIRDLISDARHQRLSVCNERGRAGQIDDLLQERQGFIVEDATAHEVTLALNVFVMGSDLNEWARRRGDVFSIEANEVPWVDERGQVGQKPAATESASVDFAQLATRQQLIDAFGSASGMSMAWFHSLQDRPWLRAARKIAGRGQRNALEPYFCPYMVMDGLIHQTRKKKVSPKSAWSRLKQHFPAVYEKHAHQDPREQTG